MKKKLEASTEEFKNKENAMQNEVSLLKSELHVSKEEIIQLKVWFLSVFLCSRCGRGLYSNCFNALRFLLNKGRHIVSSRRNLCH